MFPKKMDLYFTTPLVVCQFIFLISKSQHYQLKNNTNIKKQPLKRAVFIFKNFRLITF